MDTIRSKVGRGTSVIKKRASFSNRHRSILLLTLHIRIAVANGYRRLDLVKEKVDGVALGEVGQELPGYVFASISPGFVNARLIARFFQRGEVSLQGQKRVYDSSVVTAFGQVQDEGCQGTRRGCGSELFEAMGQCDGLDDVTRASPLARLLRHERADRVVRAASPS